MVVCDLVLLKAIVIFGPYFIRAFWGLFFTFSRILKQIQNDLVRISEHFFFGGGWG